MVRPISAVSSYSVVKNEVSKNESSYVAKSNKEVTFTNTTNDEVTVNHRPPIKRLSSRRSVTYDEPKKKTTAELLAHGRKKLYKG